MVIRKALVRKKIGKIRLYNEIFNVGLQILPLFGFIFLAKVSGKFTYRVENNIRGQAKCLMCRGLTISEIQK